MASDAPGDAAAVDTSLRTWHFPVPSVRPHGAPRPGAAGSVAQTHSETHSDAGAQPKLLAALMTCRRQPLAGLKHVFWIL